MHLTRQDSSSDIQIRVFFLGYAVPEDLMEEISKQDRNPQTQANKLQWSIIAGIEQASGQSLDLLSSLPISDYPRHPILFAPLRRWNHTQGSDDVMLPFINFLLLKHVTRYVSCLFYISRWLIRNRRSSQRVLLLYALHSPHLHAALAAKRLFGGRVVNIVPDVPLDTGMKEGFFRKIIRPLDFSLIRKGMKKTDGLVVLTRQISEDFAPEVPSLLVEGMISPQELQNDEIREDVSETSDEFVVMYAGGLHGPYGSGLLLKAFQRTDAPNLRLWIFGTGELSEQIEAAARNDSRITYWGYVPLQTVHQKMREASLLVNPRPSLLGFTAYSFPSKIMEYLASGLPVISTRLPGIPEEYFDYLYPLDDETPEGLSRLLMDLLSRPRQELRLRGQQGKQFVRDNKSYLRQGERIWNFLKEVAAPSKG